jgi:hypothetical protein
VFRYSTMMRTGYFTSLRIGLVFHAGASMVDLSLGPGCFSVYATLIKGVVTVSRIVLYLNC